VGFIGIEKIYAEPEKLPLSSSKYAPMMAVSPLNETFFEVTLGAPIMGNQLIDLPPISPVLLVALYMILPLK